MHATAANAASTTIDLLVNGRRERVVAAPDTPLLYVLRNDLALNGPKFGCGLAQCGACTVHLGGEAIRSCLTPVSAATKAPIITVEGLGTAEKPHPLQQAFIDEQAAQCGYCINGMVMTAAALLAKTPKPTEIQLREALNGNLCRCGTHYRILRAVRRAAGMKAGSSAPAERSADGSHDAHAQGGRS
jgi:nicotinate dehydrogenase subunit A